MTTSRRKALAIASGFLPAIVVATAQAKGSGSGVMIGVVNDMSGPYADIAGRSSLLAVPLAMDNLNDAFRPLLKGSYVMEGAT